MIRRSSHQAVFSWIYKTYISFLAVETYDILMKIYNSILSERRVKELDNLFDYNFQEGKTRKLLNISIIQSEKGINIDHK